MMALILTCEKQTEVCEGLARNLKGHSKLKFQNIWWARGNELWKSWTGMILYSPLSFHWKWIKSHPQNKMFPFSCNISKHSLPREESHSHMPQKPQCCYMTTTLLSWKHTYDNTNLPKYVDVFWMRKAAQRELTILPSKYLFIWLLYLLKHRNTVSSCVCL